MQILNERRKDSTLLSENDTRRRIKVKEVIVTHPEDTLSRNLAEKVNRLFQEQGKTGSCWLEDVDSTRMVV